MRKMIFFGAALLSSAAPAAAPADVTFEHATLADIAGKVASQCMNRGWTIIDQTSNQVTCQVPMNFGKQLLADLLMGSRYSTETVTYVQFNMAQINEAVRAQARAWMENQSAFGQRRQTPITDGKSQRNLVAFLERIAAERSTAESPIAERTESSTAPSAESSASVAASNLRTVEAWASSGQCGAAQRFATSTNDPTLLARVQILCPPTKP